MPLILPPLLSRTCQDECTALEKNLVDDFVNQAWQSVVLHLLLPACSLVIWLCRPIEETEAPDGSPEWHLTIGDPNEQKKQPYISRVPQHIDRSNEAEQTGQESDHMWAPGLFWRWRHRLHLFIQHLLVHEFPFLPFSDILRQFLVLFTHQECLRLFSKRMGSIAVWNEGEGGFAV